MPRRSPAPARGTITHVSRHQGGGCLEALRQDGVPCRSLPLPPRGEKCGLLWSNLSGRESYIEWLTGLAPAHKDRLGIRYRLLIFWPATGGMLTHVSSASISCAADV